MNKELEKQKEKQLQRDRDHVVACCVYNCIQYSRVPRAKEWTVTLHIITPSPARRDDRVGRKKDKKNLNKNKKRKKGERRS